MSVSPAIVTLLERAQAAPGQLSKAELVTLLALPEGEEVQALYAAARAVRQRVSGKKVYLRGLIEMGNLCAKDCYYCGIRKSNTAAHRYTIRHDDALRMAQWTQSQGYGSIVLQSGELEGEAHTVFIEELLKAIRALPGPRLGITLSLGEQEPEVFRRWKAAGADRYLLRIESSDPTFYAKLHPADHRWERRRDCLRTLRALGYQVGTGVMIGLPGETLEQMAEDIRFFQREDIDMIGMGPWLPHKQAPLGQGTEMDDAFKARQLGLGLRMIAATRLQLHTTNIAAATALQAIVEDGREQGLLAGANVVMPNVTDAAFRPDYQLYDNKPCIDEDPLCCKGCLETRIRLTGGEIAWNDPGTPPHYSARQ